MSQVIVFPRGQLSPGDKAAMREMGIAVVEADDPSKVVTVIPMASAAPLLTPDDLTMALFEGATQYDGSCAKVLRALRDRMLAREQAKAAPSVEVDRG